jgi:hypothetical protein
MTYQQRDRIAATVAERGSAWHAVDPAVDPAVWRPTVATYNYGPCALVRAEPRTVADVTPAAPTAPAAPQSRHLSPDRRRGHHI